MEEFAEYILNEEDLIAKEEIIYFLAPKLGINFDKATIFKTEIARMFLTDYLRGICSFDYLEEIEGIDVEYLEQLLKDVFNEDKMVISIVKN